MKLSETVALVTGANRGLGRHFAEQLLARGAKVYATARDPEHISVSGVQKLQLDLTDPASVAAAASLAPDVNLLVNNAGVTSWQHLVTGDLDKIRLDMDTNYFGTLNVVRAFAPVLGRNGGGAILNVLSALSWFSAAGSSSYAAAKAAEWSLTNSIRIELANQGTKVTGLHLGVADTDMSASYEGDKMDPVLVVQAALNGLEADKLEVLADEWSAYVKTSLAADPALFYTQLS